MVFKKFRGETLVKYPAGRQPNLNNQQNLSKKHIKYGSRGMSLEEKINQSNQYYRMHNKAVIHKKPTPIQVVTVDYPKRSAARITEAYYRHASTTDYNGIYRGYYIDFEAKEIKNKNSFPLSNLPDHQIKHMQQCFKQGGLVFLILSMKAHQEMYLIPIQNLLDYTESTDKQSIPYTVIQSIGIPISEGYAPALNYLEAVDIYIKQHESGSFHEHR